MTLQQQPNIKKIEPLFPGNHTDNNSSMPVCEQEITGRFQENKNLPCVCEKLPHHCVQLWLLS